MLSIIYLNTASPSLHTLIGDTCMGMLPCYGRYRVLDFILSNCSHAKLSHISIIANHPSWKLTHYISNSSDWHIMPPNGNITFLPALNMHTQNNLIQQLTNCIDYIDFYKPKYVLLLSGNQTYTMDYRRILSFHDKNNADVTMGVINVPWEKAARYTTVCANTHNKVTHLDLSLRFTENNTISMGVYVFNWHVLKKHLTHYTLPAAYPNNCFGDILTYNMLNDEYRIMSYPFSGDWHDITTIQDFWHVHMHTLKQQHFLKTQKIYKYTHTKKLPLCATFIDSRASIKNVIVGDGCSILGDVKDAIIFSGVHIKKDAFVENAIVMPDNHVDKYQYISKCILLNPIHKKTGYTLRIFPVQNDITHHII